MRAREGQTADEPIEVGEMFGEVCLCPDICKYRTETVVAETAAIAFKLTIEVCPSILFVLYWRWKTDGGWGAGV